MAELADRIIDARKKERSLRTEIRKLEQQIRMLEDEISYEELKIDERVEEESSTFLEEKKEELNERFHPQIEELENAVAKLKAALEVDEVEENEELVQAKETREYLNTAAVVINRYYEELKKISSTYFIDLAYTEKMFTLKGFKKEFASLPRRVNDLEHMRVNVVQPFKYIESASKEKSNNFSIYFSSTVLSWWVAMHTPFAIAASIKRAKFLHDSAVLYHRMMHTLASLKEKSDAEIAQIFGKLLKLKNQRIRDLLASKESELESKTLEYQEEERLISFDEESLRNKLQMELASKQSKLVSLKEKLEMLESELEDVEALIEELVGERTDFLSLERDTYLLARDEREVVLPEKLLYGWFNESNMFFNLEHGLYLFNDRDTVANFIRLIVFQLRNIMEWDSVKFKVLDLLGAEFISPLMLPMTGKAKTQDITIYTLREEREQSVELMHDLLIRRKLQILQTTTNLGDYNLIQKASGSSPQAYQIIFILLTDAIKMDEKLIQLIHSGEKLGILVFIFMKEELLTVQLSKSIETYFKSFSNLSDSGVTTYLPEQYTQLLEEREADRKSRI